MTKPKKRTKTYRGADAKTTKPVVHRYKAEVRSPLGEWWHSNEKKIKFGAKVSIVTLIIVWLIAETIRITNM